MTYILCRLALKKGCLAYVNLYQNIFLYFCILHCFQLRSQDEDARFQRALWEIVRQIRPERAASGTMRRMLRLMSVIGPAALPPELLERVCYLYYTYMKIHLNVVP